MPGISRVVTLQNEVEATIMETELERRGIPHVIRSFHDSAYDGLYQMQKGWGVIEADEKHRREIEEVYADLRQPSSSKFQHGMGTQGDDC